MAALLYYEPGDAGVSLVRDTSATQVSQAGVVQDVAANILRDAHHINGVRTTLVEEQRTTYAYHSEPTTAQLFSVTNATEAAGFAGLVRSHAIPANGLTARAYQSHGDLSASAGQLRPLGFYVIMEDGLGPPVMAQTNDSTSDFIIVAQSAIPPSQDLLIRDLGGGVYRVSLPRTLSATAGTSFGILRFAANRQRVFRAGGFQMETNNGARLSSYIRAEGVQTSRAPDVATIATGYASQTVTQYDKYHDVATNAVIEAVNTYVSGSSIALAQGRAYHVVKVGAGTLTLAEMQALTRGQDLIRVITESLQLADSQQRYRGIVRVVAESVNVTEVLGRFRSMIRTHNEPVTLVETQNRFRILVRQVTDVINVTDSASKLQDKIRTVAESLQIEDSVGNIKKNIARLAFRYGGYAVRATRYASGAFTTRFGGKPKDGTHTGKVE